MENKDLQVSNNIHLGQYVLQITGEYIKFYFPMDVYINFKEIDKRLFKQVDWELHYTKRWLSQTEWEPVKHGYWVTAHFSEEGLRIWHEEVGRYSDISLAEFGKLEAKRIDAELTERFMSKPVTCLLTCTNNLCDDGCIGDPGNYE